MKKKIFEVLSVILVMAVVLSCCTMAFTASAGTEAQYVYYIDGKNGANTNAGSENAPFKTLGGALTKAVADANAGNYNVAGSTVYFKILGTDPVVYNDASAISFNFTLNISSKESGAVLDNGATSNTSFCGPVVLENVKFKIYQANTSGDNIYLFGKDFTVKDNEVLDIQGANYPQFIFCTGSSSGSPITVNESQEITFINKTAKVGYFTLGGGATTTYNADLNLNYSAPGISQDIKFDTVSGSAVVKYNKNVNLNLRDGSSVKLIGRSGNPRISFGADSAVQIINSTGTDVTYDANIEAALFGSSALVDTYLITNNSGIKDLLEFTETAGKYKVNADSSKTVTAKLSDGTTVEAKDGYIVLPQPGKYEIIVLRDPICKDYYVSAKGVVIERGTRPATAGTKENPVRTFTDVTFLLEQDNLASYDVARVYFVGGEKISWNREDEVDPSNVDVLVYPVKHNCKVEIDSTDPANKPLIESYYSISFWGDTVVRNVSMNVSYRYAHMCFNNNNVIFEESSEISAAEIFLYAKDSLKYSKDLDIQMKGKLTCAKITLGASYFEQTTSGNIKFLVDNPEAQASFVFGGGRSAAGPNVYNGNVDIIIKNAKSAGLSVGTNGATLNGALHVLANGTLDLPYSFKQTFENIEVAGGKWYFINATDDPEFVSFTSEKGKLAVKDGATAYSRQYKKDMVTHTGGTIDLSAAPGSYTISNKKIDELTDDSHKMLYFYTAGNVHKIVSQTYLVAGETYIFEYKMYCNNFNDLKLLMGHPDSDGQLTEDFKIVEKELVGNYYKVKAELNVPSTWEKHFAHIGWTMPSYTEGVVFDRHFYRKGDASKSDLTVENQKFYDGLDGVKFDGSFWGNMFTGTRGGKGITYWTDGLQELRIMNVDTKYIDELIRLANPNDGKWWDDDDYTEDTGAVTLYGSVNGIFKDSDGNPVKNVEFELISADKTYKAKSNKNGEFDFGKVLIGFYDLFIIDGSKKVNTNVSSFVEEGDVVTINLESDISELKPVYPIEEDIQIDNTVEEDSDNTETDEVVLSGNLSGTVYTPYLDTVSNLKVYLRDIGEVVTDENGNFAFANIPVGEYELYTILADNSEYSFRKVNIGENQDLSVKLKYDPAIDTDAGTNDNGWIIWVIIASGVALVVVAGVICLLLFKKKKD